MPCCAGLHYVTATAAAGNPVLRYEDAFFRKPATVGAIARHLGLYVGEAEQARIFAAYTADRVRAFGLAPDPLPPERVKAVGDATRYDDVTHIHRTISATSGSANGASILTPRNRRR